MKTSRKLLFVVLLSAIGLLVTEVGLRFYFHYAGYQVGSFAPGWQPVHKVDTLITSHSYYTDGTGIFRADSLFWAGMQVPIDANGFRKEAGEADTTKGKVLLIGDSFAWGAGATSLDSSCADVLAGNLKGILQVYNTGIPGADPAQYAVIADSLIPKLRPLAVVVLLYMGNDVMDEPRIPMPNQPLYYITNTGWLPGYYNGHYFPSADSSYHYYLDMYMPKSALAMLVSHTAIGTLLLSLPIRMEEKKRWDNRKQNTVTNTYLKHIQQSCDRNGTRLMVFPIPYSGTDLGKEYDKDATKYLLKQYPAVFSGIKIYPLPMTNEDYLPLPDGHFNNKGHKKAGEAIWAVFNCEYKM